MNTSIERRTAQLTSIIRSYSFVITCAEGVQDGGDVDVTQHTPAGPKKENKPFSKEFIERRSYKLESILKKSNCTLIS
jgi:hypothetical protein